MSSVAPGRLLAAQRRKSPRRRDSSQSSMPRSRLSSVHASVALLAVNSGRFNAVRRRFIDASAPGTSPATSFVSASMSRISHPVLRLIGEVMAVYFA
jgi:hypothetical protein